jgi:hypothetical protein
MFNGFKKRQHLRDICAAAKSFLPGAGKNSHPGIIIFPKISKSIM